MDGWTPGCTGRRSMSRSVDRSGRLNVDDHVGLFPEGPDELAGGPLFLPVLDLPADPGAHFLQAPVAELILVLSVELLNLGVGHGGLGHVLIQEPLHPNLV